MLTTQHRIRPLQVSDLHAFLGLTGQDPVVNVFTEYRARVTRLEPKWLGGEVWGRFAGGQLTGACHVGANLVPVGADASAATEFGERALAQGRASSTIFGPQDAVRELYAVVADEWSTPRELRWEQPHLELARTPAVAPDPLVRLTTMHELNILYPSCVAMYTEEVGVSPEEGNAGLYRARVTQLIARGWSFSRIEHGRVIFKAEVACATDRAAQIQGVYVPPDRRGEGIAAAGIAAVVQHIQARIAPVASLYVNDWNAPARAAYARCGFVETARFATVLY
ncbi:MAG: GNAT family N-acetyltransferase [Nocardioides sp.]